MVKLRHVMVSVLAVLCVVDVAAARITIRRHTPFDAFFFHAQYSTEPFLPGDGFTLEIWNCATGEMPIFIADREPLIICRQDGETAYTLGALAYAVDVPAGACVDHGRSCYYRDPRANLANGGVRYFRVQYARRGHGNRVWLESYDDLSAADQARMLIVVKINGRPRATLGDTFTPLPKGGWYSAY
jgi:hypothetical protein